jgi:hypothetical protein
VSAVKVTLLPVIALAPVVILPELAARVKEPAAPALPVASVTTPAVSVTLVLPVELAFRSAAFVEAIETPPLPAAAVSVAVVKIPVELTLPLNACRLSEVAALWLAASVMLPNVDWSAIDGAVMPVKAGSERLAEVLIVAVLPAVMPPEPRVTVCPAKVSAVRVTLLPVMALTPVVILPELAVRVNVPAAPALPEARVIRAAAVSVTLVLPVDVALRVVALVEAIDTPEEPAAAVSDGVVKTPVEVMPAAAPVACRFIEPVAE